MRIKRRHEQPIAEHGEAAVHGGATEFQVVGQIAAITPDLPSGPRVDRPRVVVEAGDVEHAVGDDRRRLEAAERARLERPLRHELADVLGRDLRERAVPLAAVVPAVGQPPGRILQTVQQILRRHLRRLRRARLCGQRGGGDLGLRHCGIQIVESNPQSAIRDPQSAIRDPQSAIRDPQYERAPFNGPTNPLRADCSGIPPDR